MRNESFYRDKCDVLEERAVGSSMASKKEWVVVRSGVPCRACEASGDRMYSMTQRGFDKPWIVLFDYVVNPNLTPTVNRLRVTNATGVHEIDVRSYRDEGGTNDFWGVEGDEVTTKPVVGR